MLQMAMSPDGSTVVSLGADESLRLWKIFEGDVHKKVKRADKVHTASSKLSMHCR